MRLRRNEDGSALLLVLVAVMIFGIVAAAVASFAATSYRKSITIRYRADKIAAANAGVNVVLDAVRTDFAACTNPANPLNLKTTNLNGFTVDLTCKFGAGTLRGRGAWAMMITSPDPKSFDIAGTSATDLTITGPIFFTGVPEDQGNKHLFVKRGYIQLQVDACAGAPTSAADGDWLTIDPAVLAAMRCDKDMDWWEAMTDKPSPPPKNSFTSANPNGTVYGDCTVFEPGRYTGVPNFNKENYFKSGVYYFDNVGAMNFTGNSVAGKPGIDESPIVGLQPLMPSCAAPSQANDNGNGTGATFILGRSSRIVLPSNSTNSLEIFLRKSAGYPATSVGTDLVSVMTLDSYGSAAQNNTVLGYDYGNLGYSNSDLSTTFFDTTSQCTGCSVDSGSGNNPEFAARGLVYVPRGTIRLNNVTNNADGQYLGGIVAARAEVQRSNKGNGLIISVLTDLPGSRLFINATARGSGKGADISSRVVADVSGSIERTTAINSWRTAPTST